MSESERRRRTDVIVRSLGQVSKDESFERSVAHFRQAVPDYGMRVANAWRRSKPR